MKIDAVFPVTHNAKTESKKESKNQNFWNKEISLSFLKNDSNFKANFYSELSVLVGSDMDLRRSLEVIISSASKENEVSKIKYILEHIINGDSLSEALNQCGSFSLYDISSIRLGEESGNLAEVLKELSTYYTKRIQQKRQITGALTYPILVLLTTIFCVTFMLNYIVPMFEEVFKRFEGTMPPLTKAIIRLSDSFLNYTLIILAIFLGAFIVSYLSRKEEWYRKLSAKIILSIPVVKNIVFLNYKVRYCQTIKLLIGSKVHLLETIELLGKIIGFYPVEKALIEIKTKISTGLPLSESMEAYSFFDKKMIAMTKVGEEVNRIDVIYDQLYKQYSEELDVRIKTMNNLLEPLLIIIVGLLVGVILISMYMPIFQLGTSLGV